MKYEEIFNAKRVKTKDGKVGRVLCWDAGFSLSLDGGPFRQKVDKRRLKAKVRFDDGQEREIAIGSLTKVEQ